MVALCCEFRTVSEAYNPETVLFEKLEALTVEAGQLRRKRDAHPPGPDRDILDQQLREVEDQVEAVRRELKQRV